MTYHHSQVGSHDVGKRLNDINNIQKFLVRPEKGLVPHISHVAQFNSDYLQLLDANDMRRGRRAILSSVILIGVLLFSLAPILICYDAFRSQDIVAGLFGVFLSAASMLFLYGGFYFWTEVFFTYRYFPIRFDRCHKKIYAISTQKKLNVFDWHKMRFAIYQEAEHVATFKGDVNMSCRYELRGYICNVVGVVTHELILPFACYHPSQWTLLEANWYFLDAYMTRSGVTKLVDVAQRGMVFHDANKETLRDSYRWTKLQTKQWFSENNTSDTESEQHLHYGSLLILVVVLTLARYLSLLTCRQPNMNKLLGVNVQASEQPKVALSYQASMASAVNTKVSI